MGPEPTAVSKSRQRHNVDEMKHDTEMLLGHLLVPLVHHDLGFFLGRLRAPDRCVRRGRALLLRSGGSSRALLLCYSGCGGTLLLCHNGRCRALLLCHSGCGGTLLLCYFCSFHCRLLRRARRLLGFVENAHIFCNAAKNCDHARGKHRYVDYKGF